MLFTSLIFPYTCPSEILAEDSITPDALPLFWRSSALNSVLATSRWCVSEAAMQIWCRCCTRSPMTGTATRRVHPEMEITEIVVLPSLVTNAFELSGEKATSFGLGPTGMLAMI